MPVMHAHKDLDTDQTHFCESTWTCLNKKGAVFVSSSCSGEARFSLISLLEAGDSWLIVLKMCDLTVFILSSVQTFRKVN